MRWLCVALMLGGFISQQFTCCVEHCAPCEGTKSQPTAVAGGSDSRIAETTAVTKHQHRCGHHHGVTANTEQLQATGEPPRDNRGDQHSPGPHGGEHHLCVSSHLFYWHRGAESPPAVVLIAAWLTASDMRDRLMANPSYEGSPPFPREHHALRGRSILGVWLV